MKNVQKTSHRFRFLFVPLAQGLVLKILYYNPLDYVINKPMYYFIVSYDCDT